MTALVETVTWIKCNLEQFKLSDAASIEQRLGGLKPLGELVLTMDILRHRTEHREFCYESVAFAWEQVQQGDLLLETLTVRPDLIVLSALYSNFISFGHRNKKLTSLFALLASSPACRGLEFPNWRRLDVLRAFDSLALEKFPEENVTENCWFNSMPEPWIMSDDIAYAVTHDIFYITDFGRLPHALPDHCKKYLEKWLPSWLEIFGLQPNWDITAELLMVAACIGMPDMGNSYERLANAIELDGLVPSPPGAGGQLISLEGASDYRRIRFLSNYHTCLVSCMAFALSKSDWPNKALKSTVLLPLRYGRTVA